MGKFTKLISCITILLLGISCGLDAFKKSIQGSAVTPLGEKEKGDLAKYGNTPMSQLQEDDKKAVITMLANHISDIKKLYRQTCHAENLLLPKDECIEQKKKCLEETEKADPNTLIENEKNRFAQITLPPELISKFLEKTALWMGSDEVINTNCGDNTDAIKAKMETLVKELNLSPEQLKALVSPDDVAAKNNSPENALAKIKTELDNAAAALIAEFKKPENQVARDRFKALSKDQLKNDPEYLAILEDLQAQASQLAQQGVHIEQAQLEQMVLDFLWKVQAAL